MCYQVTNNVASFYGNYDETLLLLLFLITSKAMLITRLVFWGR